ncbi:Conserved_hypothetical protein [Hexamita inflata]|uniref:Uncharacterized protein n=1 Tax=Hexamita inflata TaxID=28002 RepID=A0AA86UYP5_9EUKA|nr:Conserved hypothetical protein [Hexamita inflata]
MRQVITVLIGTLFILILLLKRSRKPKTYKITRFVTKDQHLTSIINEINSSRIPIPSKPNKIQPPKPAYERRSFAYPSDKNDIFYYETLIGEKSVKTPVVIVCFMGGHSKSACIRRAASEFYENGHPVYILLPRGSLDTRIHPQQIKFRSEGYDTEDINSLLGLIPNNKVILVGYSLGGFNVCHTTGFITEVVKKWFKYFNKIQLIIYMLFLFIISCQLSLFCFLSQNKDYMIRQTIIIRHVQKIYRRIMIVSEDASLNFILLYVFCNQYQKLEMNRFFQLKIQQQTVSEVSSIQLLTQITSTALFLINNYLAVFSELYLILFLKIRI